MPNLQEVEEGGISEPIIRMALLRALVKTKDVKAMCYDNIPVEVLHNQPPKDYVLKLFNKCFKSGVVPSVWWYVVL